MIERNKKRLHRMLRWSERYTKTDMVYFASGNFWLIIGRIVSIVAGFGLTIALANILSPSDFGAYKYIVSVAGIIGAFSLNGLGASLTRALNRNQQNVIPSAFRVSLLWSLPSSFVAFGIGCYYFYMGNTLLGWSLLIIALTNPLQSSLTITKSLFSSTGDFKTATFYNIIRNIAQILTIVVLLFLTKNVLVVVAAYLGASVGFGYITYKHSLRVMGVTDDPTHLKAVIHYAKHMSAIGTVQLFVAQIDQILLWHLVGPVALATYSIAQGPTRELRTLTDNIGALALPKIAGATRERAENVVRTKTKYLFFSYLPVVIGYIVSAPLLFRLFFPQYISAVLPSQIFALSILFQSRTLADIFLFSHGTVKNRYYVSIPSQIARTTLFLVLIPLYGLYGAVFANILAEITNAGVIAYVYRRKNL